MSDWGATHSTVAAANAGLGILLSLSPASVSTSLPLSFCPSTCTLIVYRSGNAIKQFLRKCTRASSECQPGLHGPLGRHGHQNSHSPLCCWSHEQPKFHWYPSSPSLVPPLLSVSIVLTLITRQHKCQCDFFSTQRPRSLPCASMSTSSIFPFFSFSFLYLFSFVIFKR